jgi:hypothetical protein
MRRLAVTTAILATACDFTYAPADGGTDGSTAAVPDGAIAPSAAIPCLMDGGIDDQCPGQGLVCCQTTCANTSNDPQNCGGCGTACSGLSPMCIQGACAPATCVPPCGAGLTCCDLPTPSPGPPRCAVGATCPVACPPCG